MNDETPDLSPDNVVEVFNRLGYTTPFAAVAKELGVDRPETLYALYQSREALGEAWMSRSVLKEPDKPSVHGMFTAFVFAALEALESRRDFSRAWLAALKVAGPLHLPQLRELHDAARGYFISWLEANEHLISLPDRTAPSDVVGELADALCAVALGLVMAWEADRSRQYSNTSMLSESVGYLLDGLLTRRDDFGQSGLLTHLVRVLDVSHRQFAQPLLEMLLKPDRAQRLVEPAQLIEALRALRPPPGPRA